MIVNMDRDLYKSLAALKKENPTTNLVVTNGLITKIRINYCGHFCNAPSVICELKGVNCGLVLPHYSEGQILVGYFLQAIVELGDLTEEDGIDILSEDKIPIRLIFNSRSGIGVPVWGDTLVGFGSLLEDKFILIEEFSKFIFDTIGDSGERKNEQQ